uniref:Uncharacterized protein n=1 Tax=Panagrolaimus sp. JU765 TaxID=591449 RepID=A0AC34QE08_9BILA
LKKFDDQQRFNLINNICRTIFGSVVEEKINFETPEVKQLIVDGLQVIQLPEAKLQFDEGSKDDDDEADLPPEELQKMAKKTIKMAFCQAFVQVIMPQFMAMSRYLAKKRSMLQKEFRNCLAVIAESYPDELHLLFQDNAQLKLEVEADLKQKKRDERKSRVEKNRRLVQDIQEAPIPEIEQNNEKENEELPMVEVVIGEDEQV